MEKRNRRKVPQIAFLTAGWKGIDDKIRDKIFLKGVTTKGEGKGLGLYLSKRIIESYGGTIELMDSQIGAAFLISVPVL